MSIVIIVIIVFFMNTAILAGVVIYQSQKGLNDMAQWSGEDFTRSFIKFISIENEEPTVSSEGLQLLEERQAWIQFLNEDGDVVSSYFAPDDLRTSYTPVELVHVYKNQEDIETTLFISSKDDVSYLIGIRDANIKRQVITYNSRSVLESASMILLFVIVVDLIIAAIVGLFFSSILTRPVSFMIERIERLRQLNFAPFQPKKTGLYKQVFDDLNDVALTLEEHDEERTKLEKMRTEWISNVSHDMKTPLASIRGYAELLQDHVDEAERKEYTAVIERQSRYMNELLEDFNLAMQLRDNRLTLHTMPVKLNSFLREMVIDLLNDVQFEQRDIVFEAPDELIEATIDRHYMKRALLNFIHNALRHNDDDTTVTIQLTVVADKPTIIVQDDGKGMNEQDVAQMFERYYRGSNTEDIQGTGLGTAIARDIIEAHEGTVHVNSTLGEGTTITISLHK